MSIRDIISDCGGAPKIHAESQRLNALAPTTYAVAGLKSVYNWPKQGIPEKHWPLVMALSAHDEKSIHQANREAKVKGAMGKPKRSARGSLVEAA